MIRGRFIYFPQHILIFNVKNSWSYIQARVFSMRKKHDIRQWPSKLIFLPRVFSMGPRLFRRFFSTRRWPPDVQGPFGDQSRRKNSFWPQGVRGPFGSQSGRKNSTIPSSGLVSKTQGDTFKLEFFRQTTHSVVRKRNTFSISLGVQIHRMPLLFSIQSE